MHVLIIQRPKNYHSSQYSEIGTRKWTEIVKRGTRARNTRHRLRNQIKHPISHKSKNIDANESFRSARKPHKSDKRDGKYPWIIGRSES